MTDTLTVLVPVLNRPQNVAPLVESWAKSGTPGILVLLVSAGDSAEDAAAIKAAETNGRVEHFRPVGCHTWPEKISAGVECFRGDWFLLAADDVTFEPGWWEATERFRAGGYQVIGTNDGVNPRCSISGIHTTHPLVHRDFHAMGHPTSPVWPEYSHWYCDDELVQTAKARGVWAWCEQARITHHHPYFDESVPMDATYELGEKNRDADFALWAERCQMLGLRVQ